MFGDVARLGNRLAGVGELFQLDVRDLNRHFIGLLDGVAGGSGAGNVREHDTGGGVLVAPFDGDRILHGSSSLRGGAEVVGLFQPGLFSDAVDGAEGQVLLRVGDRHRARLVRVLENMVTAPDAVQIPAVRFQLPDQVSAFHLPPLAVCDE